MDTVKALPWWCDPANECKDIEAATPRRAARLKVYARSKDSGEAEYAVTQLNKNGAKKGPALVAVLSERVDYQSPEELAQAIDHIAQTYCHRSEASVNPFDADDDEDGDWNRVPYWD